MWGDAAPQQGHENALKIGQSSYTHTHAHKERATHTYAYIDNVFGELINTQREERCQQQ